ncbi:hypothetical protein [Nostoc sp.]
MQHKPEDPNPKSKTVRLSIRAVFRREAEVQILKSKIASQTSMIDG